MAALRVGSASSAAFSVVLQQLLLGDVAQQIALCTPVLVSHGSDTCCMVGRGYTWAPVVLWAGHGASWRAAAVLFGLWCA